MISVVIPCHNSEAFVGRALESVLRQTYREYEIILVDNNSTDGTLQLLHRFRQQYPDLVQVLEEPKKGAPAARNKGLSQAKGEWIQFLDSDDELLPDKLEHQWALTHNAPYDVVVGNYYSAKETGTEVEKTVVAVETKNIWKGLLTSRLGITSANLWRREALLAVNGWNETMTASQEYDLLFRMLKMNEKVGFCPLPLTYIHVRENSIQRSSNKDRIVEVLNDSIKLRIAIKDHLKAEGKLTRELNRITDTRIFTRLMMFKHVVPDYVKKTLHEMNLDIPYTFLLKFYLKPKVKKMISSFIYSN